MVFVFIIESALRTVTVVYALNLRRSTPKVRFTTGKINNVTVPNTKTAFNVIDTLSLPVPNIGFIVVTVSFL